MEESPARIDMHRFVFSGAIATLLALILVSVGLAALPLQAAGWKNAQDTPLRVATKPIEPFVIVNGDNLEGFSVDLWGEIAARLGLDHQWVRMDTVTEILDAVENGSADVAIAGISMTPEREQRLDFTHPFFDAGLQIMVREDSRPGFVQWIGHFFSRSLIEILAVGLAFAIFMGIVIWLLERRRNPEFQHGILLGVVEGIWWLFGVIATGEYPDKESSSVVRRLMTVLFWLVGVALVAQLTGTIASNLTMDQLRTAINGPNDLPGKQIATVDGSTAAQYLEGEELAFLPVTRIEDAYKLLEGGTVDAVVYDAPVLLFYAARQGQGRVQVVGQIFKPEKYGIALPKNSPLRKPINEALLEIYQDGTYETLQQAWFDQGR